ncbi:uncharacterized protein LOC131936341 [Physella acuta]|uniref:uncharacterized protein LOC131936341 n=1 Tax=Physella acuta TaxID=109671 RepID=UPI0027DE9BBD|nr:uncharacterized protein LOC131936341 [Physella acuta]
MYRLLVCFIAPYQCLQCQSPILGTFFQLLSGTFSNSGDPGRFDPDCPQDLIEVEFLPVQIKSMENFTGGFTILFTERVNGAIYRLEVLTVKLDVDRVIHLQPYNITDNTVVQGGQVNRTLLSALGVGSFQTRSECEVIYRAIESNNFVAAWPDCTGHYGGELATYTISLSCNALSFVSVLDLFHEKPCNFPYVIWLKERFPLPPNMVYNNHGGGDPCNCPAS